MTLHVRLWAVLCLAHWFAPIARAGIQPYDLRAEYMQDPAGIDSSQPRLSWKLKSSERNQVQSAYRILVASRPELLEGSQGDLWDSGKVASPRTLNVTYGGKDLGSGQACFWKVRTWDGEGRPSAWSSTGTWFMGVLQPQDWRAQWISFRDESAIHDDRQNLELPPARHYRREFNAESPVKRAILHATALGVQDMYLNGRRISERFFAPGWADYHQRAYYQSYDVTPLLEQGANALGAVVADGWYAGYVGYGLLVGYGPNQSGRNFYGKTPALMLQLEVEYEDGTRACVVTDPSWKTTSEGPWREADLIMGEHYDARRELNGWSTAGFDDETWENAMPARQNGSRKAMYHDRGGVREVELGFQEPLQLQAYSAQPIVVTGELPARRITEPRPGAYLFDLGQNFAGVIRLNVKGTSGTRLGLRYGEMLHPDGRLMTENLRRARATDTYIMKGDPAGEVWIPRFTYHGFQFVEVSGLPEPPTLDTVTGLVLNNDTPLTGSFACSDPIMTKFWTNTVWTQRANFVEVPTDCPQRDERLGWMGDAQTYVRTATFNADVAAFFTKWMDDVVEAQRSFGAYPDYAPYPMQHGGGRKAFGSAWTDAGIIVPWTIWKVYGDTRMLDRNWDSMTRFMEWRKAISPRYRGVAIGNGWGDWLNVNETTPIEFIDASYFAYSSSLMAEMAEATGRPDVAAHYRDLFQRIKAAFIEDYVLPDGSLKVNTQTAYCLALEFDLLPENLREAAARFLANRIIENGHRMATGFLGTRQILPALTSGGQHDLAVRLFQSRRFPSWGYEVVNGANTVWERWDSFTVENGFNGQSGDQNASMNSFSHYAFGAVMEWAFRNLAGIDTATPGYGSILLIPQPPTPESNPEVPPIHWVRSSYNSPRGPIHSEWELKDRVFTWNLEIPANTSARITLPATDAEKVLEEGRPWMQTPGINLVNEGQGRVTFAIGSGAYSFTSNYPR